MNMVGRVHWSSVLDMDVETWREAIVSLPAAGLRESGRAALSARGYAMRRNDADRAALPAHDGRGPDRVIGVQRAVRPVTSHSSVRLPPLAK